MSKMAEKDNALELKRVEMTREEAKMYQHLDERCRQLGTKIFKPYWGYIPRAKSLYPDESENKARGLYRGNVKHLIDLGALVWMKYGVYSFKEVHVVLKSTTRKSSSRGKGGSFKVVKSSKPSVHLRLQLILEEAEEKSAALQQISNILAELNKLALEIAKEL